MIRLVSLKGRYHSLSAGRVKENRQRLIAYRAPGPENDAGKEYKDIESMKRGYEEGDESPSKGAPGEGSKGQFTATPPKWGLITQKTTTKYFQGAVFLTQGPVASHNPGVNSSLKTALESILLRAHMRWMTKNMIIETQQGGHAGVATSMGGACRFG